MDTVMREMLLQAKLHATDPTRRLVWLDAAPCLLQVPPPAVRPCMYACSGRWGEYKLALA